MHLLLIPDCRFQRVPQNVPSVQSLPYDFQPGVLILHCKVNVYMVRTVHDRL